MPNYIRPKTSRCGKITELLSFSLRGPHVIFPSLDTFHFFLLHSSFPPETKYFSKYFFLFLLPCIASYIFLFSRYFPSPNIFSLFLVLLLHKAISLLQILSPPFFFSVFLALQISSVSKYFLPFPSPPQTKYFPTFLLRSLSRIRNFCMPCLKSCRGILVCFCAPNEEFLVQLKINPNDEAERMITTTARIMTAVHHGNALADERRAGRVGLVRRHGSLLSSSTQPSPPPPPSFHHLLCDIFDLIEHLCI